MGFYYTRQQLQASPIDIRKWHVNGGGWGGHGSSFMEEMFAEEKKRK